MEFNDHNMDKKNQAGLSLIEVLISMLLISVLFVLFQSALNSVILVRQTSKEDLAYHVASKEMEALRGVSYASLTNANSVTCTSDPGDPISQMLGQIQGSCVYSVTSDYGGMSGVKQITVTVSWTDRILKQVTVQTLAGSGGINPL